MATYTQDIDNVGGGGWMGGGSGMFAMIILLVVVFWVLFRGRDGERDGHYGHEGYNHYGGFGCGPCVRPAFIDESNYEEERNINAKLCKIEMEQQECCCKELEATHCEGEKTRALIEQNYIQDLRDRLNDKNMENLTLKNEMFTEKRFDQVLGAIAKMDCECVKRPPVWAECNTPNSHDINCREGFREGFSRRGRCGDFDGCCA